MTAARLVNCLLEAGENVDWTPDDGDIDADLPALMARHPDIRTSLPTITDVTFTVEAEPELEDYTDHFDSGEPELDRDNEAWIAGQLRLGNVWAWCSVKVTATWTDELGKEYEGADWLGCCSYRSKRDFMQEGGYYTDMQNEAYAALIKEIAKDKDLPVEG